VGLGHLARWSDVSDLDDPPLGAGAKCPEAPRVVHRRPLCCVRGGHAFCCDRPRPHVRRGILEGAVCPPDVVERRTVDHLHFHRFPFARCDAQAFDVHWQRVVRNEIT